MFPKPTKKKKAKKGLRRIRKTPLSKLKRMADQLASEKCRARGTCEAKGKNSLQCEGMLQWAHIIRRGYNSIRWLPQNCLCLCRSHHWQFTNNPELWIEFLMKNYQETYLWLCERKEKIVPINRSFLENTLKELAEL